MKKTGFLDFELSLNGYNLNINMNNVHYVFFEHKNSQLLETRVLAQGNYIIEINLKRSLSHTLGFCKTAKLKSFSLNLP